MKNGIMSVAMRLIIITAAAGLLLGLTYSITKEPIAKQEELAKSEARIAVLSSAEDFEQADLEGLSLPSEYDAVTEAFYGVAGGERVGASVTIVTKGYSSGLQITVGINQDGTVAGVNIDSHSETPGLGTKAAEPDYLSQYYGKAAPLELIKTGSAGETQISAVSGATMTSRGVLDAVNLACQLYADYLM